MKITELITYIKTNKNVSYVFLNYLLTWANVHNLIMYVLICINNTTYLNIRYSQVKMSCRILF